MISLIIPSHNNLQHLKNCINSVRKYYTKTEVELIILDDASTDNTWEWINNNNEINIVYRSHERVGHTILYDLGIDFATSEIVGILHADMIVGPNFVENMVKHLTPKSVVCATRVEPPLHPAGKEKLTFDFGMDFDTLRANDFCSFCENMQLEYKDETSRGIFAPWIIYKSDFLAIGGHDFQFAPFPLEDSDIFQRWILAGYKMIQSRDSFVYHLTCRGHRWTETVGVDDEFYKKCVEENTKKWIRKWGIWIENDEYQYPIIYPRYRYTFVIKGMTDIKQLELIEPYCDVMYTDLAPELISYYKEKSKFGNKIHSITLNVPEKGIVASFDLRKMRPEDISLLPFLQITVSSTVEEPGKYTLGECYKVTAYDLINEAENLIYIKKTDTYQYLE